MSARTGVAALGVYTSGTMKSRLQTLQNLIPSDAATPGTGAIAGGGNLDEMSPSAAVQLQVELDAMIAANTVAFGQYTVVAQDATNTFVDIVTGLSVFTLANIAYSIRRAGTVQSQGVVTQAVNGTIHIAAGGIGPLVITAGDVITWFAQ